MGDACRFPTNSVKTSVRVLRAPKKCAVRTVCSGSAADNYGHAAGVEVVGVVTEECHASCMH